MIPNDSHSSSYGPERSMETAAHAAGADGNASRSHHPHVLPLRVYYGVAAALIVFTAVTYMVAQLDLGAWNMVVALGVAAFKATLVLLFFMHLKYDNRLYAIIFSSAILFLAIFIVLTMFDTETRGVITPAKARPIVAQVDLARQRELYASMKSSSSSSAGGGSVSAQNPTGLTEFELTNGLGPIKQKIALAGIDDAQATAGEAIFGTKCGACHKLDERLVGPPLREVTKRRTPEYVMNMILNPDEMTHKHPVAMDLVKQYFTYMTFQNVTQSDARAILEYLRKSAEQAPQPTQGAK